MNNITFIYLSIFFFLYVIFGQDHIHWGSTNNPLNGLTITWHSTSTTDEIRWGYTTSYEEGTFPGTRRNDYSGYLYDYTFPTVNESDLIHYSIFSSGSWSTDKTFQTSISPSSTNFTFVAGGDSRTYMANWQMCANWLNTESVDFHLFLGDHVNNGTYAPDWDAWYSSGVNLLENHLLYHTGGNHEYGTIYLNQFVMPSNEKWYSFEFGNALFICLLTEEDNSSQDDWLVNELSTTTHTWKIVFFHRPFFTTGSHAGEMDGYLDSWWQAFDDYGVDVILNGHTHYYLRSKPINLNISSTSPVAEYGSKAGQGRLEVVAGSYGAPLYSTGSAWFIEENLSTFNYAKFEIDGYSLHMDSYNMSGTLIDSLTITKEDQSLPVELSSFIVSQEGKSVKLAWTTSSEIENLGFIIERRIVKNSSWDEIASYISNPKLKGQGSVSYASEYELYDNHIEIGQSYEYRLIDVNFNGERGYHLIEKITTEIDRNIKFANNAILISAFPNPFNQEVQIRYTINNETEVSLIIFDLLGREVKRLILNNNLPAGNYSIKWDGTDKNGRPAASGIYFPTLIIKNKYQAQKVLLKR